MHILSGASAGILLLGLSSTANAEFMGEIDPVAAFDWIHATNDVILLDVRTGEEWWRVGHPGPNGRADSNGKGLRYKSGAGLAGKVVNISWAIAAVQGDTIYYTGDGGKPLRKNQDFETDVLSSYAPGETTIVTICLSGARAEQAAISLGGEGFTTYFVTGGFEGDQNSEAYPGPDTEYRDVNGWRNAKLPWNQKREGGYNKVLIVPASSQ
jgi:rhodanese-related sulfurtransferase